MSEVNVHVVVGCPWCHHRWEEENTIEVKVAGNPEAEVEVVEQVEVGEW